MFPPTNRSRGRPGADDILNKTRWGVFVNPRTIISTIVSGRRQRKGTQPWRLGQQYSPQSTGALLQSLPHADPGRLILVPRTNAKSDITLHRIEKILGVFVGYSQQL